MSELTILISHSSEMISLIDCLSVALVSNSFTLSCTCLCHQSDKFRSTQTLGSTTIQNRISRRNLQM